MGPISAKRAMSAPILPVKRARWRTSTARLQHMDDLKIDIQVLISDDFPPAVYAPSGGRTGVTRSYNRWLDRYLEKSARAAALGGGVAVAVDGQSLGGSALSPRQTALAGFLSAAWKGRSGCTMPIFIRSTRKPANSTCRFACIRPPAVLPCTIISPTSAALTVSSSPWSARFIR